MSLKNRTHRTRSFIVRVLIGCLLLQSTGCSRRFWRLQAENDTYDAIAEKMNNPHWQLPRIGLSADPRSRFHDPYDPDCAPLPPDDPSAHCFMHCADGKEGYKHWGDFGGTATVENPHWLEPYGVLMQGGNPVDAHGQVVIPSLNLRDSLELTYIHSRGYQTQLENVYLTGLALTGQRYLLNTRFSLGGPGFGGALYNFFGSNNGVETHQLRNGLGLQQALPSGGQFAVSVLNNLFWTPGNGVSATGLAWQISQPLLEGAGRKVRMEVLVQAERDLLYAVRDMARFRQTIFANVADSYLAIQAQSQSIRNQENNIRQLTSEIEIGLSKDRQRPNRVSEPLALFPRDAEIPPALEGKLRWDEESGTLFWTGDMSAEDEKLLLAISDDERFQASAQQLIRWRANQGISLSTLQLITQRNSNQNRLEGARRVLADLLDAYKIVLGLPPDVEMTLDDAFLAPFELIDRDLLTMIDELKAFQEGFGARILQIELAPLEEASRNHLKDYVTDIIAWGERIDSEALGLVEEDFVPIRNLLAATETDLKGQPGKRGFDSQEERDRVIRDVAKDLNFFRIVEGDFNLVANAAEVLQGFLKSGNVEAWLKQLDTDGDNLLSATEIPQELAEVPGYNKSRYFDEDQPIGPEMLSLLIRDSAMNIREELLAVTQNIQVVQAGLRVEVIALNPFQIDGIDGIPSVEETVRIGLANRHDLMNSRAEVMDARRAVEVAANRLKALMDLNVGGGVGLGGANTTDDVSVSLDFKAPLDQVLERNAYNTALVAYQRARRAYMADEDAVKLAIRSSWRQLQVSRQRLEIDRQTVRNAALEYDSSRLNPNQNNSLSLVRALDSVLDAQESLVGDWVSYESNRLNIFRDMGIMRVNQDGVWEDSFYLQDGPGVLDTLPPAEVLDEELLPPVQGPPLASVSEDLPVLEPPTYE
ncbi:MAG: TolC family protein [Planctomycetaceae bacterium]|nr:TolC family protein [Planctomycetaceae bacterium]